MNPPWKFIENRTNKIDKDFLDFEVEMLSKEDKELIDSLLLAQTHKEVKLENPHNSILLYALGLSDEFDFSRERSDTIDGTPPDMDIDFSDRNKAMAVIEETWGADRVCVISTQMTMGVKKLTEKLFRLVVPPLMFQNKQPINKTEINKIEQEWKDIQNLIPEPKFGKAADLERCMEEAPQLKEKKIGNWNWFDFVEPLEDRLESYSSHASGVIISDFPIHDHIPLTQTKAQDEDRISISTQFDMAECEKNGLIKFDILKIDNLLIISKTCNLIEQRHGIRIDPWQIPDKDEKTYEIMGRGLLSGIFQMETSGSAKQLIEAIKPQSISELSDITAANRPGPMQAGLHTQYIENKSRGKPPKGMPEVLQQLLSRSYWTLLYQEDVMKICSVLGGYSERDSDDIRRALGKKKKEVLEPYKNGFVERGIKYIPREEAAKLWEDIEGYADYALRIKCR